MKKILVPTDFSEVSENAVRFAIDLSKKVSAEITLFNSIHFDYFHNFQYRERIVLQTIEDDVKKASEKRMDDFIAKLQTDVPVEKRIEPIPMVTAVKEMIKEKGFDLVVMGTHGSSGVEEFFVGSNTEKIVRHAPCPVISVPHSARPGNIKKVLVPVDLREVRASFLRSIADLQKVFDCELEFIWVNPSHDIENEESLGRELTSLMEAHGISNYKFFIVKNITPMNGIFMEAAESGVDMIAMATHARRGISHLLSGSMTEDTVNHIGIPVWSFRIDKEEKVLKLDAVTHAKGKPLHKKIWGDFVN